MSVESDLYPPVKRFLEAQGYEVKGEVAGCDLCAARGDEPPVVVELKTRMSLDLVLQGVDRLALTDAVYLAVPAPAPTDRRVLALCRRLGLGLLRVDAAHDLVEPMVDPVPYQPRKSRRRVGRLLREHARRVGDPNRGGVNRVPIVTAYRQRALRIAARLAADGPARPRDLARSADASDAGQILRDDHYGWFERVAPAIYDLTPKGRAALDAFAIDPRAGAGT